jgi:hypothetical protein
LELSSGSTLNVLAERVSTSEAIDFARKIGRIAPAEL